MTLQDGPLHLWKSETVASLLQTSRLARIAVFEGWRSIYGETQGKGPGRVCESALVVVRKCLRGMNGPRGGNRRGVWHSRPVKRVVSRGV